uniref:Uncharacterized protein n=1 Tax=Lactuca sativa TaxID=4236 RepID=A0A9R1XDR7_LACSA|nr:hypothetical protein LSAT_V11C400197350 [Lactuca sativa]
MSSILTGLLPLGVAGPKTVLAEKITTNKEVVIKANFPRCGICHIHGLLADHDFIVNKNPPIVAPAQAFAATVASHSTYITATSPIDPI